MEITVETTIQAPREAVFQRLVDFETLPQALSAIRSLEVLTPGPVAVGTRFRETRVMHGMEATEEMTVAELEPPRLLVLTARSHGTAYRASHELSETDGGTLLRLVFEGRPVNLLAWLTMPVGWLMIGTVRSALAGDLADLKRACEVAHAS